ncbi:MAG: helix-turn-helix domain-containing protein [Candidatus Acidiferrales bacterium]
MRAIPVPMRKRILQLYERGQSTREIAQFFGFCVAAVRRVRQQFRQRGTLQPRTHRSGRRTLLTEERKQRLQELLSAQPDATLAELGARLDRPFRTSTVDLWLRRLGWKYKKNSGRRRTKPARRGRKKSALARAVGRRDARPPSFRG